MQRQRKEILNKINEIEMFQSAELDMGCGFFESEICSTFQPLLDAEYSKLARTYGKTLQEYWENEWEWAMKLPSGVPFR